MTATEQYIERLMHLKIGELGLLRIYSRQGLDQAVDGFDLFTGLWWPLRQNNEHTPRRDVAWLVAKLYAFTPIPQSQEAIACQLARCQPKEHNEKELFAKRFDWMLTLPLHDIEPALRWALDLLSSRNMTVDWIKLTDDLSNWKRESIRLKWAKQYLKEGRK